MRGQEDFHPLREVAVGFPLKPGVYRFLNASGRVIYVGKAKALRKRVLSYFSASVQTGSKTAVMLQQAASLELTVTSSEEEALLLEADLIKRYQPRYNVLLRDGKSYPYLHLSTNHPFPRLTLYRGERKEPGRYFGPFPSVHAVRGSLQWLQRAFPIRTCDDRQFASRKRPCLQYQIKRCSGPCCDRVEAERYGQWVAEVVRFLGGRDNQVVETVRQQMWKAAEARRFEEAAELRDRLKQLERIQRHRQDAPAIRGDADVIAAVIKGGLAALQILMVRGGRFFGSRTHFPNHVDHHSEAEIIEAFLGQFYTEHANPGTILVSHPLPQNDWLQSALQQQSDRRSKVVITTPQRGPKRHLVSLGLDNALDALDRRISSRKGVAELLERIAEVLLLPQTPSRIEVYDVSHIQDTNPVASMIVHGSEGFEKGQYRRFSIRDRTLPDDTARMREILTRRFKRLKQAESEEEKGEGIWPDLVLLDGGRGQLNVALDVSRELQLEGISFRAIAKGPDRHAGRERLFLPDDPEPLILDPGSAELFFLQNIRDEAHRFAITYHRARRQRSQKRSQLDGIQGIGAAKKRALLKAFGSVRKIADTSVDELATLPGITAELAQRILDAINHQE
ncbi:MAG: excinuclease ABC subunit UvrC [Magnetococcales bacterium]|nr:excinuclease ABC subunit UvrC [Magnetococcales bacterium]